ncbi:adenine nucleotide alpha hydrolase [Acuticoccus kandeliae]|uniref:adenine nucleotide alpha hydrolase n=1 Tax=Acuticoccus kandeliae TaxID=2073160 RepID=UPI000D3EA212|nr:adenine nucleotide alpha hydrolase [Acuticoccus kandeliae]
MSVATELDRLRAAITRHPTLAIAVSGGVDSMVLTHVAHGSGASVTAIHAVSPAVPVSATERVKRHAARHNWTLRLLDAGEMNDPDYLANPVNRCFFCKTNLYSRIRSVTEAPIASGTNADDLGDYRPGLQAAEAHGVVHPFVEAGIGKDGIYALAAALGLSDLERLPAQPCLASRIETGIPVDADMLIFIDKAENALREILPDAEALRCRVTAGGIVAEISPLPDADRADRVARLADTLCHDAGRPFAGIRPYRRGSAFLHPKP